MSSVSLVAGSKLGPYEILSPLGAGGMGEVFRARDAKLQRDVAIKVLPVALAGDPEALARFEREALAVAALSHPNILTIFDFGSYDGVTFAVMELLEGETLRGKLAAGPILQKQAIDYGVQIARGLSAAHEKGVVHRALKPENLFVTRDGHLKILDFGLAKRVEAAAPSELASAPTVSMHTEPGTVMGTVGYMSPEQVRGLPVDHRSDIFSLGAVLYELLSGKKAFKRDTSSDTMAAIMRDEPPELSSQSGRKISPALDHLVRHCLEKDRDHRFQTARDVAFALSEASESTVTDLQWLRRGTSSAHADRPPPSGLAADHIAASGVSEADLRASSTKGRRADADKITDGFAARYPHSGMTAVDLGDNYALTGNDRRALEWLTRAYDARAFTLFTIRFDRGIPPSFFEGAGWKALWQRPLFQEWLAAHERVVAELGSGR